MRTPKLMITLSLIVFFAGNAGDVLAGDSAVPDDFLTIQAAIDDGSTVAGDTITLNVAGIHVESNINITKSVTIQGLGIGTTTLDASGGIGFRPEADDITIQDMTITNGSQAVRFEMDGGTIDNTTLYHLSLLNHSSRGIEVHNATTVTDLLLKQCHFENTNTGFRVSSSGTVDGAKFLESTFLNNVIGIYEANDGSTSTMKDLEVKDSSFTNHSSIALYFEEIQDALIEGNQFTNNRRDIQILKWYQAGVPISNVVIQKNTMNGTTDAVIAFFNAHHTSGQTIFNGITVTGNAATIDPTSSNNGSAMYTGAHSTFQNASPSDGGLGWDTVDVSCNNFLQAHTGTGVRFFNPTGVPGQALGGATLDVDNNWWGTTDLGTVQAQSQIPVVTDFTPILPAPQTPESCPLVGPPANKNECKKDGWMLFNNPFFKNQGDCVSYVATGGKPRSNK